MNQFSPSLVPGQSGYGQLGTLYTLDQYGNATSQTADTGARVSWTGQWYQDPAGLLSSLALPLIDVDPGYFGLVAEGNPSQNGLAFPICPCLASLEWVFGAPPQTPAKAAKPDVVKPFPETVACTQTPNQLISDMEGNFSTYANYEGDFNSGLVHAVVHFSGSVSLGATISIYNHNFDNLTGGERVNREFDVAVRVTQVTSNSFTFATLPGHVLYPATITFTASSTQPTFVHFEINVKGNFANLGSELGYYAGGSDLENKIWNHVLDQVKSHCSQ